MNRLLTIPLLIGLAWLAMASPNGATAADIVVEQAWSRATPGPVKVGVVYLTLRNLSDQPDRLLGAAADGLAERIEIHENRMDGTVMSMRPLPDGVALPSRQQVTLAPNGSHLMLIGLRHQLKRGDIFSLTLHFANAKAQAVQVKVFGPGAGKPES